MKHHQSEESSFPDTYDILYPLDDNVALGSYLPESYTPVRNYFLDNFQADIVDKDSATEQPTPRKLRESKGIMPNGKKVIQQRPKGQHTVRTNFSLSPDLKTALNKAAKEQSKSSSLLLSEILSEVPEIAEYLPSD